MRCCLNFCSLPNRLDCLQTSLGVNQVRRENGVDECRLSKTGLSYIVRTVSEHCTDNFDMK